MIEYSTSFFYFLYQFFTGKIENQNHQLNSQKKKKKFKKFFTFNEIL